MDTTVVREVDPGDLQALYRSHWWFEDRTLDDVRRSLAGTDEFVGLRASEDDRLVASCRVLTDYVYLAKLLDVIVAEDCRRQGLGTELVGTVRSLPELQAVEVLTLECRAGLIPFYEGCGFQVHEMLADDDAEDYVVMTHP